MKACKSLSIPGSRQGNRIILRLLFHHVAKQELRDGWAGLVGVWGFKVGFGTCSRGLKLECWCFEEKFWGAASLKVACL